MEEAPEQAFLVLHIDAWVVSLLSSGWAANVAATSKRGGQRETSRAVVYDRSRNVIALIESHDPETADRKYDLPGGGLSKVKDDSGKTVYRETPSEALLRELSEEVGISEDQIRRIRFLGISEESREALESFLVNHISLVVIDGPPTAEPRLSPRERRKRQKIVWLPPDEALARFATVPESYTGRYDHVRGLFFLTLALHSLHDPCDTSRL